MTGGGADETVPEFCRRPILVLGCGNILFGDDGFGPAVVEQLESRLGGRPPERACIINAGTSSRTILFTVTLSDIRPRKIIIVDAVDAGRRPGEVFSLSLDEIPPNKIDDFCVHQIPTSNLLRELRDHCGIDVEVVSCQVERIPETVLPGLSDSVQAAVPKVVSMILDRIGWTR